MTKIRRVLMLVAAIAATVAVAIPTISAGTWNRSYGRPEAVEAWAVDIATDDGVFVGGRFVDAPDRTWVSKLDVDGNVLWTRSFPGLSEWSSENFLSATADGGVVVSAAPEGSTGFLIVKLSAAGATDWERRYEPPQAALAGGSSVRQTADGGYIASGRDAVLRLDSAGNVLWNRRIDLPLTPPHLLRDVVETPGGDFVLSGFWVDTTPQAYLLALDSLGSPLWELEFDALSESFVSGLDVASDGSLFVSGSVDATPTVLKLDSAANIVWQVTTGSTAWSVKGTADGGCLVVGNSGIRSWILRAT